MIAARIAAVALMTLPCVAGTSFLAACRPAADVPARPTGAQASRIICLGPNVTELVFALGAGDRVVGVSDFCDYPADAAGRQRVGGAITPNLEKILELRPDLVIVAGEQQKTADLCRRNNIGVLNVQADSIEGVCASAMLVGERLGKSEEARKLCDRIRADLDAVRKRTAGRPRPRVFLCLWRSPESLSGLASASAQGFLGEVLEVAGGENIFADLPQSYSQVSKEELVARRPDVVIELRPGEHLSAGRVERLVADWQELAKLPAVKNHRVYVLTQDFLMLPGPRIALAAGALADVIHPEAGP